MKILITGATGGIGQEVCTYLASCRHELVMTSRNDDRLSQLQTKLQDEHGTAVQTHAADFADLASVQSLLTYLRTSATDLQACVLIYPGIDKPNDAFPSASTWTENFTKCFVHPLELLRCVSALMPARAKIAVVSGIASTQVFPKLALTNAIRSAWLAQVKTLSFALGKSGQNINSVSLGAIATNRIKAKVAARRQLTEPLDLLLQEEACGNAVVVHRLLSAQGTVASVRTVQRAVESERVALRAAQVASVRYETAPGQQMQIDFGEKRVRLGGVDVKVHFFVAVLGYSRRIFVRAFLSERHDDWREGIVAACEHLEVYLRRF